MPTSPCLSMGFAIILSGLMAGYPSASVATENAAQAAPARVAGPEHAKMGALLDPLLQKVREDQPLTDSERQEGIQAFSRYWSDLQKTHNTTYNYMLPEPDRTDFYINAVKMGFIDWNRHGGWAFRSPLRGSSALEIRRRLNERYDPFLQFSIVFPYRDAGHTAHAVAAYEKLVDADPFLARSVLHWSFRANGSADWLLHLYRQTGETVRAANAIAMLGALGLGQDAAKRYEKEEARRLKALADAKQPQETVAALFGLAHVYLDQKDYAKAKPVILRLVEQLEQGPPDKNLEQRAMACHLLADTHLAQGGHQQAEASFVRLLEQAGAKPNLSLVPVKNVLFRLADLYLSQKRHEEAEPFFRTLLAHERETQGPQSAALVPVLLKLGPCYRAMKQYARAELMFKAALKIVEEHYPRNQTVQADIHMQLSNLYRDNNNLGQANDSAERALDSIVRARGANHPDTIAHMQNLAMMRHDSGRHDEAADLCARADAIRVPDNSFSRAESLWRTLGLLHDWHGRLPEAERAFQQLVPILVRTYGEDHRETAIILNLYAGVLDRQDKHAEAETIHRRVLAIMEKAKGVWPDYEQNMNVALNNLAQNLLLQGKNDDAVLFLGRAWLLQKNPSAPAPNLLIERRHPGKDAQAADSHGKRNE